MRTIRRVLGVTVTLAVLLAILFAVYAVIRNRPQDMPWTGLDLAQPIGLFTGRKLAALGGDFPECRALLDRAGVRYTKIPAVSGEHCGYSDGVRLKRAGAHAIGFSPAGLGTACPVAAGLAMWEWDVLQPAAERYFDSPVETISQYGSYSCRRLYGRDSGPWSEHATADAVDIAGVVLADGTRITVAADWNGSGDAAAFLHDVRDGACKLFATVLSPDYNAAHRDHFHLDQARRGEYGGRACR